MSKIKGKDTKPEALVRSFLFSRGFRYRKNVAHLPGRPDIVLSKYRTCIFVNGCFWHRHEYCRYFVWPKNNKDFWKEKIEKNVERDQRVISQLTELGWNIITIWECQLKKPTREATLALLEKELRGRLE